MKYVRSTKDGWVYDATPYLLARDDMQAFDCEALPPEHIEDLPAFLAAQAAPAKRTRAAKGE